MTPEEHYKRGLTLLEDAEQARNELRPVAAQIDAIVAGSHFQAAAAGTAMRAFEEMSHPKQVLVAQAAEPAPEPDAGT